MVVSHNRVFIYGQFVDRVERARRRILPPPPGSASIAIEILREFSASELVGKVYALTEGRNWQPVSPMGVRSYQWFVEYLSIHKKSTANRLYFETQEKEYWEVLYFRQESDESSSYMAVALRHSPLFA